jgi:hypothetical protein
MTDPNRGVNQVHLFHALDAFPSAAPFSDDLEDQVLVFLGRDEVEELLFQGESKALTWAADIPLALLYLDRNSGENV